MQKKLTLIFMLLAVFSYSQSSIIKGRLLDKNTNDSLPYVSIGILKKGIGTVSKSNGSFSLDMKNALDIDTVKFSSLGYKPLIFKIKTLKKILNSNPNIKMEESIENLDEVIIMSKKNGKKKYWAVRPNQLR